MDINTLVQKALNNDKNAEEQLFKHLTVSFRVLAQQKIRNRQSAEEISQNALLVVFKKYKSVKFEKSFLAWAYKVLTNNIMDYISSRKFMKNQPKLLIDDNSSYLSWEPDYDLKIKLLHCLEKIGKINNRFARILNLRYLGYSTEEICRKLELKQGHFYVILSRARSMLDICLKTGEVGK